MALLTSIPGLARAVVVPCRCTASGAEAGDAISLVPGLTSSLGSLRYCAQGAGHTPRTPFPGCGADAGLMTTGSPYHRLSMTLPLTVLCL